MTKVLKTLIFHHLKTNLKLLKNELERKSQPNETNPGSYGNIVFGVSGSRIKKMVSLAKNKYSRVWNRRRAGNNRRAWKICQKE